MRMKRAGHSCKPSALENHESSSETHGARTREQRVVQQEVRVLPLDHALLAEVMQRLHLAHEQPPGPAGPARLGEGVFDGA